MTKPSPSNAANPVLNKRRLWLFRLLTVILIPVLFLGLTELVLSISDYGYPTSYFVKRSIDGQDYLVPNYQFSNRFFPAELARKPNLSRIPARKAQGVYRIFVFGESAALGDPEPSYGVSRYLDVLLDERYPDTEFEIICVAMTAINSHVILPIARECARLEGDLWIIYMGNNEMIGPFGAGTIFGAKAPPLGFVRAGLALKKTHLGQLTAAGVSRLGPETKTPDQWGGINMFNQNLLRHDDPKKQRAYKNFESNLKDILATGHKAGVPIILSSVGSNLRNCSPFASLHREDLDASDRSEWERLFNEGLVLEQEEQFEQALNHYEEAAAIDTEFAELQFRMGTCQLAMGRGDQAKKSLQSARDYDALAVRADTRINRILMDAIPENGRVQKVDATSALSNQSPQGIPGKEMFNEHVHYTVEGNFALARLFADQVHTLLPPEILASQTENWLEHEVCNRHLALTVWDQVRLWGAEAERVNTMPFVKQSSNTADKNYIHAQQKATLAQVTKSTAMQDLHLYESALQLTPEDTLLVGNYAQFLDGMGMIAEAIEQADRFRTLLPDAWTEYYMAALLAKAGRLHEAEKCLEKSLEMNSDLPQAQKMLKQIKSRR